MDIKNQFKSELAQLLKKYKAEITIEDNSFESYYSDYIIGVTLNTKEEIISMDFGKYIDENIK